MLTADEELEVVERMNPGSEKAYVYYSTREKCWKYSIKRPTGRVNVDFEVVPDVDRAYNLVQEKNFSKKT